MRTSTAACTALSLHKQVVSQYAEIAEDAFNASVMLYRYNADDWLLSAAAIQ